MLEYRSFSEIVDGPGLSIVLVKGMPSPWGQAVKTIFEIKGLDYVAAPWMPGEPNADIVAWGGEAAHPSSPGPRRSRSITGSTYCIWPNGSRPSHH